MVRSHVRGPLNGIDPTGLWGWGNVKKWVKKHGAVVAGVVAVAALACSVLEPCGLAVVTTEG